MTEEPKGFDINIGPPRSDDLHEHLEVQRARIDDLEGKIVNLQGQVDFLKSELDHMREHWH